MGNVIWKTSFDLDAMQMNEHGRVTFHLPAFSRILTIDEQGSDGLQMWFRCDPKNKDKLSFDDVYVIATGEEFETNEVGRHISTVQMHGGSLVLHFFTPA